jgi:hypothetical protein
MQQAVLFLLALVVRAMNKPAEYDSDDEIIAIGRSPTLRQPLVHGQNAPATGVPVPTLDQRTSRHDAWSQRMREKVHYLLDHFQHHSLICATLGLFSWLFQWL